MLANGQCIFTGLVLHREYKLILVFRYSFRQRSVNAQHAIGHRKEHIVNCIVTCGRGLDQLIAAVRQIDELVYRSIIFIVARLNAHRIIRPVFAILFVQAEHSACQGLVVFIRLLHGEID